MILIRIYTSIILFFYNYKQPVHIMIIMVENERLLTCSSEGFTNILTLQINEIECCYSQYIGINEQKQSLSFPSTM